MIKKIKNFLYLYFTREQYLYLIISKKSTSSFY